ncbi:hypothetical protein B566_EDAN003620 [Ephemera danica]|nr:hypothetical protein B566_EDAN003620 [Ephemera danica]
MGNCAKNWLPPSITRNHQGFSEKLDDVFPSPITASAVGLRRPGIRRDSEAAGLGSGEFDLSALSKRSKNSGGADDGHNSVVAAAASMLQQAAAAAVAAANQSTPEDFSPKSRRNNEISENNHHPHTDNDRNERSPNRGEDVKSEPLESCPNIEVDTEDSVEGREPSSVASGQDETDNSAQGPPPGHFHHSNVQEKLQSLFSGSSPSQPAFNFNLPVSRLSEAASLSGLANAAGLNQVGPDLGVGSQDYYFTFVVVPNTSRLSSAGFVLPLRGLGYRCEPCGKNLTSPQRLRRHIQNVHAKPVKPPVCNICNKVYSTLNSLRNHKSIYHRALQRRPLAGDIH